MGDATEDTVIVDKVSVDFDVSGDYKIELAEVFNGASANPATYFYRAAYADGNPSDEYFQRVRVRYGRQTGRTLLGAHFNLDLKGFMFRSEYVCTIYLSEHTLLLSLLNLNTRRFIVTLCLQQ